MSRLEEKIKRGEFVITAEIGPPKGTDLAKVMEAVAIYKGLADAVNITDQQAAVMRAGSLAVARRVLEAGLEPIVQMTCRDRNKIALQSDLLSASILGIENVLVLRGDDPTQGDHPDAKPVFELETLTLLKAAKTLEGGQDLAGKSLEGTPTFFLGAAANPGAKDLDKEFQGIQKKMEAGAEFFQTQAVYEPEPCLRFLEKVKPLKPVIILGVIPLKSGKMARYMNEHVFGIHVSEPLIDRMERSADKRRESIAIAVELVQALKAHVAGFHFMPIGWDEVVPEIVKQAGLMTRKQAGVAG